MSRLGECPKPIIQLISSIQDLNRPITLVNLLDGRYAPVTDAIGFLDGDFSTVVETDQRWRAGTNKRGAADSFSLYGPEPTEWLRDARAG